MLNLYFEYANFIQGGIHTMKKRFLSIALTLAMVSSMAVGCGSSKSDSADSKKEEGAKTEASADTESNQILFNGSSTLAPVITSMATTFFDTMIHLFQKKISQSTFQQADLDREPKPLSMELQHLVWLQEA